MTGIPGHDIDADAVRYLAGEADAQTAARLNAALREEASARARFAELARLHGQLGEIGRRSAHEIGTARLLAATDAPDDARLAPAATRPPPRRWITWGTAAAAGVVLAFALMALLVVGLRTRALIPTIASVHGPASVWREGGILAAAPGLHLRAGDRLSVADGGALEIVLTGGRCTLGAGAEAAVEAADEAHRRLVLERGSIAADLAGHLPIAVRTAAATITVSDAAAVIAVDRLLTAVAVSRGSVDVLGSDGSRDSVPAGGRWSGLALGSAATAPPTPAIASKD